MPPAAKPFFRFTHAKPLRTRTLGILDAIDMDIDPCAHREALANLIVDLTGEGMNFFFLVPLTKLKMGMIINQSASLGVGSVVRIMGPILRNIIGRMDKKQLRHVSKIMREMMV